MSRAFAILGFAALGVFGGGLAGLILANPVASIFVPIPADPLGGAIWMLVGGFWGALIGLFCGVLLALRLLKLAEIE